MQVPHKQTPLIIVGARVERASALRACTFLEAIFHAGALLGNFLVQAKSLHARAGGSNRMDAATEGKSKSRYSKMVCDYQIIKF